ncbi:MAG: hypothetical protein IKP32_05730 [Clostridia bacterium]|nr:hypothetical protein [Clostridia bacterium]
MLGKPEDGWALFQLGSEETAYDLSYVTDVAVEWLAQAIHGLTTLDVFSVHGYCEPGRMVCTVSYWCCYVIFEDDDRAPGCHGVTQLHVSMLDFCRMLHRDISENLDDWVNWNEGDMEAQGDGAEQRRKAEIREKLDALARLIEEKKEDFEEDHCFI